MAYFTRTDITTDTYGKELPIVQETLMSLTHGLHSLLIMMLKWENKNKLSISQNGVQLQACSVCFNYFCGCLKV